MEQRTSSRESDIEEPHPAVEDIIKSTKEIVDKTIETAKGTIDPARATANSLIKSVKDTTISTAAMVEQSYNIQYQVAQRRPWLIFGGAVLVGYVVGSWTSQNEATQERLHNSIRTFKPRQRQSKRRQFEEEWNILKSVALSTLIGTLRTMIQRHTPTLTPQIDNVIDRISAKLATELLEPSRAQEGSQNDRQSHASENYAAHTSLTEAVYTSTLVSQGIADSPLVAGARPHPYTQYRR